MTRHFFVVRLSLPCVYSVNCESFCKYKLIKSSYLCYTMHTLGKKEVIFTNSCGISFSKERKKESQRIQGNQGHFFRCTVDRVHKRVMVRHWARKICVCEDWRAVGGCLYEQSSMSSIHVETWDRRRAVWDAVHKMWYVFAGALEFVLVQR